MSIVGEQEKLPWFDRIVPEMFRNVKAKQKMLEKSTKKIHQKNLQPG